MSKRARLTDAEKFRRRAERKNREAEAKAIASAPLFAESIRPPV